MRKLLFVLLSAAMVLSADALADTHAPVATNAKVKEAKKCLFPKSMKRAPTWVCNAHSDGSMVTAVGMSAKSGAGIPFMEQMAAADARAHLAKDLRGAAQNKIKGSKNSANKDTVYRDSTLIIQITNDSLQGTKIMKSTYSPDGTLYVLVGLDKTSAKKLIKSLTAGYLEQQRK